MKGFIKSYQKHRVDKYLKELSDDQMYLKQRVFDTIQQIFDKKLGISMKNKRLLDVGSADGSFVEVCTKNGVEAYGIDISDGCNFESDKLPFNEGSHDIVTMNSIIEHLHNPHNIMSEIRRVLKPEGYLVLITPNWRYSYLEFYDDPTHVTPYTIPSLFHLFDIYGFKIRFYAPWLVKKSTLWWKLPQKLSFFLARWLPFKGLNKNIFAPSFLKGRTKSVIFVVEK